LAALVREGRAFANFKRENWPTSLTSYKMGLSGWTVAQMMASYNQFHASDDPQVRAVMDQIARQAFYGVTQAHAAQAVQAALAAQAQQAHDAWVVQEKARVRAAVDANVAAYNQSQDKGYWGGLVDTLSIAGHGVVNFGSGVVNFASSTVNLVVDVVQT
jgi:hypothetical protein